MKNIKINFGHKLLDINFNKKLASILDQQNNITKFINPEIIIGTDGVNSTCRSYLDKFIPNNFTKNIFDKNYKELSIPTTHAKLLRLDAMHIWSRDEYMLVAQPNLDGSFTAALIMKEINFLNLEQPGLITEFFKKNFADVYELMPNLESEYKINPIGKLNIITGSRWSFDNFLLIIGDAAHGMVPFFGQGVNCCFEDCTVLADCSSKYPNNWPKIFELFENTRIKDANAICEMSYENYPELFPKNNLPKILLEKQIESVLATNFQDSFRSYHNLVCFSRVPYSTAQQVKSIQATLIKKLSNNISHAQEIDYKQINLELKNYQKNLAKINLGEYI